MNELFAALLVLGPKPFDWQVAADKIAPYMAWTSFSKLSWHARSDRFTGILGKVGMRARYDDKRKKQIQGLFIESHDSVHPISGCANGSLVFIHRFEAFRPKKRDIGSLVAFLPKRGKMKACLLDAASDSYLLPMPQMIARLGNRIVVVGCRGWIGNGPRVEVRCYGQKGDEWTLLCLKTVEAESWLLSELRVSKDGKRVSNLRIRSRTYPKYLYASHATAHLTYDEEWRFPAGIPKLAWKRLRDTPYNALDNLYGAIQHRNRKKIAYRSRSAAVAKAILNLYPRTQKGRPDVEFVNSYCDSDAKVLVVANLRVWFHFVRYKGRWVVAKLTPYKGRTE